MASGKENIMDVKLLIDYHVNESVGLFCSILIIECNFVFCVMAIAVGLILYFSAGLALLQKHKNSPKSCSELIEAPEERVRDAAAYHQFAEAAYTVMSILRHFIWPWHLVLLYLNPCAGTITRSWKKSCPISMCVAPQTRGFNSLVSDKVLLQAI